MSVRVPLIYSTRSCHIDIARNQIDSLVSITIHILIENLKHINIYIQHVPTKPTKNGLSEYFTVDDRDMLPFTKLKTLGFQQQDNSLVEIAEENSDIF